MEEKNLISASIVTPAVTPDEAIEAWKKYEELKIKIVTENDIQRIQGKEFLKKSYWRKIATFFNLSLECVEERRQDGFEPNTFSYLLTYKAIAPNGRFAYGDGACSSWEKDLEKTEHDTRAIAHTRAFNRAVSNLVGGGEVSAEEMELRGDISPEPEPKIKQPKGDLSEVLHIGKYKNKSFEEVYKKDRQYLEWLYKNTAIETLRNQLAVFLDEKRIEDLPKNR